MIEHNIEELYKAQDEMLSEAERINAMFRPAIAEIIEHSRWGCFGDGVTHINYPGRLEQHVRGLQ